jgi:hypothetical protein
MIPKMIPLAGADGIRVVLSEGRVLERRMGCICLMCLFNRGFLADEFFVLNEPS